MDKIIHGREWVRWVSLIGVLQAHGGGVLYHGGRYYWYGENKAGPTYTAYSLACATLDLTSLERKSNRCDRLWLPISRIISAQVLTAEGGRDRRQLLLLGRPAALDVPRCAPVTAHSAAHCRLAAWLHPVSLTCHALCPPAAAPCTLWHCASAMSLLHTCL